MQNLSPQRKIKTLAIAIDVLAFCQFLLGMLTAYLGRISLSVLCVVLILILSYSKHLLKPMYLEEE